MNEEQKNLVLKHWRELVRTCDTKKLYPKMLEKKIITERDIRDEFSTNDDLNNKRMFFFHLQDKPRAFPILLEALRESGQNKLAELLNNRHTGCVRFRMPEEEVFVVPTSPIVKSVHNFIPLTIKVKKSEKFYDTTEHNKSYFYRTRSKRRGRVLIINNYDFNDTNQEYRNGAQVDEENLLQLFNQLHFVIEYQSNKTAEQMKMIIKDFATYSAEKVADICFVIIMSHGTDGMGDSIIFGSDGREINTCWIEDQFNNRNCKLFENRPKIILYQMCRGLQLDLSLVHTETDSATTPNSETAPQFGITLRTVDDMLVGHSTLRGYKAHRDPVLGTWYIELICEIFMNHCHDTPIDDLLQMVDERLKRRMSEKHTMQTSEYLNRGFKKCYIHPGIYEENGKLCEY